MHVQDFIQLTVNAVRSQRMRSFLTALGIAVGIGSVVLLTSLGEGLHRFMLAEFTQFGTNLIGINPGKVTTHGVSGALISNVRPLSIEDAQALKRIPQVVDVVSVVQGNAAVEAGKRQRRTTIYGIDPAAPEVFKLQVASGRFLPDDPPRAARSFAVLGSKVREELFGSGQALGERIRIGSERFRVIGSMESKGQLLGFDLDDTVWIPTAKALAMFNRESLMEIDVLYEEGSSADEVASQIRKILIARHGSEDFTITTQEKMLEVLGKILNILTLAVGGLGGISLLVGGVGILTIMTIAVNERTNEIGLLRALGSEKNQILGLFLGEAIVLASIGGLAGLLLGVGGAWLLGFLVPALPTHTSWTYLLAAEMLAAAVGLLAGVLPARRAAALNPVDALRSE
ncbi:MAG: ABC transporter permease [Deltaproteobacteria bacterium]|jgi:putative ABC transport system permease protein|nr:ABC transporter permease [Deltaproteobacteria bacterium]